MMKVGIIGCGGIGNIHANAYKMMDDVEVCAFIDNNIERAEECVKKFGGKAYADIDDVEEKLDLVSVVTPPATHYGILLKLIEKKIPVFCEKPITTDVDQAKEIVEKASAAGVPIGIGFKMRNEAVFAKAKELIGEIGELYSVTAVKDQPYTFSAGREWIQKTGAMYELSVHDYDLINYIADLTPKSVYADLDYSFGWERENRAYLQVEYENGVKGQLSSTYSPETKFTFADITIMFVGEKGYMKVERPDKITVHTTETKVYEVEPIDNTTVFEKQFRIFIDGLKEGKICGPNAEDGAINTIMIEAANKSNKENRKVELAEM